MDPKIDNIRRISVEHWHRLALAGEEIPVKICLDGDSMRPLIRRGADKVTVVPLRRPVRPGDIVLFADPDGRYVVHRVWKCGKNKVVTLGDHCNKPDAPLDADRIWGIVTKLERGNRVLTLDTAPARFLGRIWMTLLPVRMGYYKIRNRRGRNHGS